MISMTDLFCGAGGSSTEEPPVTIGSLFSGYGGLDLAASSVFGAETAWHCEFDANASKLLKAHWPATPNLGDITTVDWSQVQPVDIITGGFPCQDLSNAGRRAGIRPGTRSGLWSDFAKAIDVLQPSVVIIENVRGLLSGCGESDLESCPGCVGDGDHRPVLRALGRVLGDLAGLGFDAEWGSLRASDVGAPHGRFRVFIVAYRAGARRFGGVISDSIEAESAGLSGSFGGRDGKPLIPTPKTTDGDGCSPGEMRRRSPGLRAIAALIPTPTASDSTNSGGSAPDRVTLSDWAIGRRGLQHGAAMAMLPTPTAMNPNDEEDLERWSARRASVKESKKNGNGFGIPLGVAVRTLPTPKASDGEWGLPRTSGRPPEKSTHLATALEFNQFGVYSDAVARWAALTRMPPPATVPDGKDGRYRLNPRFSEWMMGLPDGWVTDHLDRRPALRAIGNGVVPQQAAVAIRQLWERCMSSQAVAA